jgi:type VI secretion system protein ImpC
MDSHFRFDFSSQPAGNPNLGDDEDFFPIAVLGDFSGRTSRPGSSLEPGVPVWINCDNFESVFDRFDVTFRSKPPESGQKNSTLQFKRLEDFHPDELIRRIEPLSRLFDLRARLLDPAFAAAAVAEAHVILQMPRPGTTPLAAAPPETTEQLLTRLLGKPEGRKSDSPPAASAIERLIKQIVAPSVVPNATTEQSTLVQLVENELSVGLRELLRDPNFQSLEAAWRGIDFLVRETGDQIRLYLLDITKAELATQASAGDLPKAQIFKHLERITPAVVLGLYTFGPGDQVLLGALGSLMESLATSFVAGASPEMVGCRSFGSQPDPDDWVSESSLHEFDALRRLPQSAHLGLLAPRFLLRQPYGPDSDPIEAFAFQEALADSEHEAYLWGNPSVLCGDLLADAFAAAGWNFDTRGGGQICGLPVHTFTTEGEAQVKPCAEAWLTERAANVILNHGIMPVASIRGRDAVEIRALQSFSIPPKPLIIRSEY